MSKQPKHDGPDEDSLARKEYLDTLPTYQPKTPYNDATDKPARIRYSGRDDDLNHGQEPSE